MSWLLSMRLLEDNNYLNKIFNINFNDLNSFNFPKNELFGIVVILNNVKYEFLLYVDDSSDKLLSIGSGAFNSKTNHDRSRPRFDRWSWDFEGSRLFYNDPTLYLSEDIFAPWGVGTINDWFLLNISKIVLEISKNIFNKSIVLYSFFI